MTIAENLLEIRRRMTKAAERSGRDPSEIRLVAVSKIHSHESIREAYEAGQRHFGENYVQELLSKQEKLADLTDIKWHFIGHLQRNKARHLIGRTALIETVDSLKLLTEIGKRVRAANLQARVLIQVKIGGEATKSGCEEQDLPEILEEARKMPEVRPSGLMVIPPFELEAEQTREYFQALRALRDEFDLDGDLHELSMGMSHDFEVAIEEGSTSVRVGTAVFGPRSR